jgi:HK97 gp10 family phage protein
MEIIDNSDAYIEEMAQKAVKILTAIGDHIVSEAQDELENDPRRVDTGNLRNSINKEVVMGESAVYIGTNVEYAPYVHYGTSKMRPNKFLFNACDRNMEQIEKYIEDELKR